MMSMRWTEAPANYCITFLKEVISIILFILSAQNKVVLLSKNLAY